MLGFLAVTPGVPYSRDKLATLFWSESGDRQARDSLKQALLRLRRSFQSLSINPLVTNRQSVSLDHAGVEVDVVTFESLLGEATPEAREQALTLYRGDLLDGLHVRDVAFDDWLLVERQRLRQLAVEASTDLMVQYQANGQHGRAAGAARRLLTFDPLHEAACRTLMQAHVERGERAQALRVFENLKERLRQELAVAPEPITVGLYQSIRRRESAAGPAGTVGSGADQDERTDEPAAIPSVAVLPFANFGEDPDQDYFVDGLTEDIITDLSRVSALYVAARNTVFAYKGTAVRVEQAARELKVRYILEGSVRRAEDQVRITAQLIDGVTGGHLWAERYDRNLDDIFALQDEIARRIVEGLKVKLLPEERASIASQAASSVEAYQYYLMGRSFYLRGMDKQSLRTALEMYAKATEIDPGYARAYAALAICESYLSMNLSMKDPGANFGTCLANSQRALDLDPNLAEAYAGKGLALYAAGRYEHARPEFQRAISLGPDLFEAQFFYARNCRLQGLREQAAALFERAAILRPNDFRAIGLFAEECQALGRQAEFKAALRRCLERLEAELEAKPDNAGALAFGSAVLADLDQTARARDWADQALKIDPADCLVQYNVARTHALLGEVMPALERLEQAFDCSPVFQRRLAMWMRYDEDIEPLRSQPLFRALLARVSATLETGTVDSA